MAANCADSAVRDGASEQVSEADRGAVSSPYRGRTAVLATMHGKETAIAPALRERLGLAVTVTPGIDTDSLGTFTGEIARAGTIGETAVAKARLGMSMTGASIGIASEGSFGPHPHVPFLAAGVELIALVDDLRGIVVTEQLIDDTPVFGHVAVSTKADLTDFLARIGFPDHAVIVRPNANETAKTGLLKGVRAHNRLAVAVDRAAALSGDGLARVETDMRAHMNPTRMAAIARLAEQLAGRLASLCPACRSPGFGLVGTEIGLPCEWCGGPSLMVRHRLFGCVACDYRAAVGRTDGLTHADPGRCPRCNP